MGTGMAHPVQEGWHHSAGCSHSAGEGDIYYVQILRGSGAMQVISNKQVKQQIIYTAKSFQMPIRKL